MLQCPLCAVVPATCLTQENMSTYPTVNAQLIALGYYLCAVKHRLVKPLLIPDNIVASETPVAEAA